MYIGEKKLLHAAQTEFQKGVFKVLDHIYFMTGYGGSNAIAIEGRNSLILIDALNSFEAGTEAHEALRAYTDKPIETLIYTHHTHFDHTNGAKAFVTDEVPIIGRKPEYELGKSEMVQDILKKRGIRQFGRLLNEEEAISIGIGPYHKIGQPAPLAPNYLFEEEKLVLHIDGIELHLVAAPGETSDHIYIWLPESKVLICGDNYYKAFPNLYAIRGTAYRDICKWVSSLEDMITLDANYLLPGHTHFITGQAQIKDTLSAYKEAIKYVLEETLKGLNEGYSADELAARITLPKHLLSVPSLEEFYGTVEWSVRAIANGYLGWFDGNPTHLSPLSPTVRAAKMLQALGGADSVLKQATDALNTGDVQWSMELVQYLVDAHALVEEATRLRIEGYKELARRQTSANARKYYFAYAHELEDTLK